jgi:ankyrin repeat protein
VKRFNLAIICVISLAIPFLARPFMAQEQPGKLARLIQDGKRSAAFEMIRSGANVNEAQADGTRPIHWAVYRVDYEMVTELIAKKAQVDVANELGYTPLAEALRQGDAKMLKMLMDGGSGTEGANLDGQTALMTAIKNNDMTAFQMLIEAGAKVNVVEKAQDQTPLMWAAANGRTEMMKVLIAKGADVNARARFTDWPSQITSEPRAQYHSYGGLTPLLYASRSGCYACVELLVNAKADVNLPAPEGITPMMIALDNRQNGIAKYFLDHGGNPHLWDVYGRTALYIAVDQFAAPGGGGGGGAAGPGGGGAPGGGRGGPGGGGGAPGGGRGGPGGGAAPGGGRGGPGGGAAPGGGRGGPGAGAAPGGGRGPGAGAAPAGARGFLAAEPAVQARGGGAQAGRGAGAPGAGAPGGGAPGGGAQGGRGAGAPGGGAGARGGGGQGAPGGGGRGGAPGGGPGGGGGRGGGGPQVSSMEIINLLLAAGVSPNTQLNQRRPDGQGGRFGDPLLSNGTTPLLRALINGNQDVARLLIEKGADSNIHAMGISPWLYVAGISSGTGGGRGGGGGGTANTALLDLMLQHGADVNNQVTGAATYSGRIARALTGNLNATSNEGMTALHAAVQGGNIAMVRYLLEKGARVDIADASGRTPMDVLNGVPAQQPAVFADASGLLPRPDPNAPPAAGAAPAAAPRAGGGAPRGGGGANSQEIRTLLVAAAQNKPK